jgi:hypothetical protein
MRGLVVLAGLAMIVVLVGCSSEPPTYRVTGTVMLDGKSVPEGDIHFRSTDGRWGAEVGKIQDGRYELMAKAGPKRVEISASRIIPGGARGGAGEPVPEEYVPEEYNVQSKLQAEVKAGGANVFDFNLTSRKK